MPPKTIVFVHGWSVTNTDTYGGLPERLAAEAASMGEPIQIANLWLARYVSFRDEVRMPDLALAMERAVRSELAELLARGERFAVITHSTGGPVARAWWHEHYAATRTPCPMSHLVMLAPANFGSALAQLGKGRISRMKSWFAGVEPGQGVLDWLEHGSAEAWDLNEAWIRKKFGPFDERNVFPFVLAGQTIDRAFYDHLNSYTGELGSDGVVRVAAANLNASLVRLVQAGPMENGEIALQPAGNLLRAPACAFRLIRGAAHSGERIGIMRSVAPELRGRGAELVHAIRRCLAVSDSAGFKALTDAFAEETEAVEMEERVEVQEIPILPDRTYVHDAMSLVIFRLADSGGRPLADFEVKLTGVNDDADLLPEGFLVDRQRNQRHPNVLTFFFNHDVMVGSDAVADPRAPGREFRGKLPRLPTLGLHVTARPTDGLVHYVPGKFTASAKLLKDVIRPHSTTLVDVVLRRVVHEGVFRLGPASAPREGFVNTDAGPALEG